MLLDSVSSPKCKNSTMGKMKGSKREGKEEKVEGGKKERVKREGEL